ncbi:MAG: hypothetical protein ABUK01_15980 [Leptospirales bacterium]
MYKIEYLSVWMLLSLLLSCSDITNGYKSVSKLGPLKLGSPAPQFAGITFSGYEVGPTTPPGKFYVYIIDEDLPLIALNGEVGDVDYVIDRGGVVIAGSDGKFAKVFGVKLSSSSPYRLSNSLIIIANAHGEIVGIYKNARLKDLKIIILEMGIGKSDLE